MPEAFICDGVRTPFGRYAGALSSVRADELAAIPLRALRERNPGIDWERLDEVILGCANQAGEDNRNVARMASLLAEFPVSVPGVTVNRLCASGLDAVWTAARAIKAGEADLVLAGGVESMSRAPLVLSKAESAFARDARIEDSTLGWRFVHPRMQALHGTDSMPETAENVAEQFCISRQDQDAFAYRSQQRYARGKELGVFKEELWPVSLEGRRGETRQVTDDEHPRPTTSLEALGRLRPIVRSEGTVTAGNASGVNDGAAALLIASEAGLRAHRLRPLARIAGGASAGVAPRIMGIGPVPASQKLLARLCLEIPEIDLVELNEAFAAQSLAVLRELGIDDDAEHVNPNGGAIAIGHPLGASGARLALTACLELQRRAARHALVSLCVGVGQGLALVLERA